MGEKGEEAGVCGGGVGEGGGEWVIFRQLPGGLVKGQAQKKRKNSGLAGWLGGQKKNGHDRK